MEKKVLVRSLTFAAYFLAVFLLFLFLLFPFERIRSRIEAEVRVRTPFELSIGRISPRFFNRFALSDVLLSDAEGRVLFESPLVRTKVSLFGLLRGILKTDLRADAYGGELLVRLHQGGGRNFFLVEAEELDLAACPLLREHGFPLAGKAGGTFEMNSGEGKGRLWVKGLAVRELKVQGFPVPDLDFEQGWIEGEIKGDRLTVRKLELEGKELTLRVTGDAVLRRTGLLNLLVKLKPSERLSREQSGYVALLKNRDAEGFYQFSLGGTVASPFPRL